MWETRATSVAQQLQQIVELGGVQLETAALCASAAAWLALAWLVRSLHKRTSSTASMPQSLLIIDTFHGILSKATAHWLHLHQLVYVHLAYHVFFVALHFKFLPQEQRSSWLFFFYSLGSCCSLLSHLVLFVTVGSSETMELATRQQTFTAADALITDPVWCFYCHTGLWVRSTRQWLWADAMRCDCDCDWL